MRPEVISESFQIEMTDGTVKEFIKRDQIEYHWSLAPSGDLLIYLKEYHETFAMAAIKDERIACYATGTWKQVSVIDTPEVDDEREVS